MTSMRVLHLAPTAQAVSGIGRYARRLEAEVDATGKVEWLTLPEGRHRLNSVADVVTHALRARRAGLGTGVDAVQVECGLGALREYWAGAALIRSPTSPPVVLTIHDPGRPVWMPWLAHGIRGHARLVKASWRLGSQPALRHERRVLDGAARIVVLTRAGRRDVLESFPDINPDRVVVVDHLPGERLAGAAMLERRPGACHIGFFGHWYAGKGVESLVAAVAALHQSGIPVRLTLAGEVTPSAGGRLATLYRESVLDDVASSGVAEITTITGSIPDAEVAAFLADLDVLVLPYSVGLSRSGTSGVLHDAQAAGVPVVATDSRALAEEIEHGVDGLVYSAGDLPALVAVLGRLALDPDHLRALRAGAAARARRLHPEQVAQRFVDLYSEVLAR
ncbi:MAG: glycosyltransferase family 4 protein [Solirubrobacteraceae bacterium]